MIDNSFGVCSNCTHKKMGICKNRDYKLVTVHNGVTTTSYPYSIVIKPGVVPCTGFKPSIRYKAKALGAKIKLAWLKRYYPERLV
jgi:hypothetical protein